MDKMLLNCKIVLQISHKPETIDDIEAAGVLYAGLTAWSGLYVSGHIGGVLGALTSQGLYEIKP